jgi:uncharacterized protein (TIGR03083 family)
MDLATAHVQGLELVRRTTERFGEASLALTPAELSRPVPGMNWTVGEVVAHMQSVYERYTVDLRRAPSISDLAAQNQDDVERLGVDPAGAVASMLAQLDTLEAFVPHIPPDRTLPFHGGGTTTMAGGWGNLMGELLAHGDDIARATSWDFTVPGEDLEITWCHTFPLLGAWLVPGATEEAGSWDLAFGFGTVSLRLDGEHMLFAVDGDLPVMGEHHVMSIADAADFTLAMPYRRRPPRDEATALLVARFAPV